MSFTISQQPDSANLFLYPNGDDTVALSRNTGSYNFECVDDVWHSPDEDTTYVYTTSTTEVEDKYTLENHGSETGTINYVRLISRVKSHEAPQESSGIYKLFLDDGTTVGYSDNFAPISYSYNKKYFSWTTKPSGGSWTWTDIDNLKIGISCNSPQYNSTGLQAVFRPNAAGDKTELTPVGDTENYKCVDEETSDGDTTYVRNALDGWKTDLYNIPNHDPATHFGTINYVTLYTVVRTTNSNGGAVLSCYPRLKINGTEYSYTHNYSTGDTSWHTFHDQINTNPDTGSDWTWTDIDNLQIGIRFVDAGSADNYQQRCTQIYLIVNYDKDFSPEIRTTQLYTVVNYDPSTTTVTLNDPISLEVSHSRRVQRFLFGSGDYEVSDFGRAGKTLNLTGIETTDTENKMNTLKTMTHYGKYVTVSGLPDSNLDGNYYITDFNWEKREGYTDIVDWNLTLEEA